MSDPETITEADLAEALDGFWLHVACGGQRVHGQVADPGEVASVLLATVGRIAAERSPDEAAPPVAAAFERPVIGGEVSASDDTGRVLATAHGQPRERPWVSEDFRIRLARAMYDSIDRCARCKVCEHQIGAAAKVMAEAVSAERERAEAAERKLAAIAALEPWETCASTGADLVRVSDIQAITGTEGESREH